VQAKVEDDAAQAVRLRREGRREEALAAARKSLAQKDEPWVRVVLGEVLRELGGRRRGYAEIQTALKGGMAAFADAALDGKDPGRFEAWVYGCRGGLLRLSGDMAGGERELKKAAALDPGCGWIAGWLGELLLRAGRAQEALPWLDRAVGLFAEWPEAFFWRGEAKRALGKTKEALRDLDHALALGYRQYDLFLARAAARLSEGDEDGHWNDLRAAVRLSPDLFKQSAGDPSVGAWIEKTISELARGDRAIEDAQKKAQAGSDKDALASLEKALKLDPANAKAHLLMSELHARGGDSERAIRSMDEAVRLDASAEHHAKRAQLAQSYGFMEAGLKDLSISLGLAPNGELFHWRARTFLGMRHYDLAIKDITTALEIEPDNPQLYDLRAHVNLLLGRPSAAQEDVERALRITPDQVNLHLRLAQILALQKKFAPARASVAPIEKTSPSWAHFTKGYVFSMEKKYGDAAGEFTAAAKSAEPHDAQLKLQASFYGTIAKAFHGIGTIDMTEKKKAPVKSVKKKADKGRVYLCGLGVYPPQTATVEVLRGISECDVIFNNLPGLGISEFLGLFCDNRRPVAFRYEQDAKLCADLVLSEVRPGRTAGFVTFGHPLLFGPLSHEIIKRCNKEGIEYRAFGAVSSMDAVLAASGQVLGYSYDGFQIFETTGNRVVEQIPAANPKLPIVVYFSEGLGEEGMKKLVANLGKLFPANHPCLLYGPRHELWDTQKDAVALKDLVKISHHKLAQGILFVPPKG
jgi:tetratricopeptide (TPR) repeat protein/precorrin-2 methylase